MSKKILFFAGALVVFLGLSFALADNVVHIEADVIARDSYLMIEVDNSSINFGEISRGEVSDPQKVCVNNIGTEDIRITPKLNSSYTDDIFENIYIKRYSTSDSTYTIIGLFNTTVNSANEVCIWLRLDLSNYTDPIYADMLNHNTDVIINAVPI